MKGGNLELCSLLSRIRIKVNIWKIYINEFGYNIKERFVLLALNLTKLRDLRFLRVLKLIIEKSMLT